MWCKGDWCFVMFTCILVKYFRIEIVPLASRVQTIVIPVRVLLPQKSLRTPESNHLNISKGLIGHNIRPGPSSQRSRVWSSSRLWYAQHHTVLAECLPWRRYVRPYKPTLDSNLSDSKPVRIQTDVILTSKMCPFPPQRLHHIFQYAVSLQEL